MSNTISSESKPAVQVEVTKAETIVVKPDWEVTLDTLRATNAELQRRKTDAERDRDLFRELYNKASVYASEVSKENDSLLERVSIAESQAKDGVQMVRTTYEARISTLQTELTRARKMGAIMAARDTKMAGEEIRRRAAEGLELKEENEKLRDELKELKEAQERLLLALDDFWQGDKENGDYRDEDDEDSEEDVVQNNEQGGAGAFTGGVSVSARVDLVDEQTRTVVTVEEVS